MIDSANTSIERNGTGIERNGTGIERNGTGIERNGTGIERNGTGIERNGTGIGRFGSALAIVMAAVSVTLSAATPAPALAGIADAASTSTGAAPLTLPATVLVRGKYIALQIGSAECNLAGTGYQRSGYARFPLTFTEHDAADQIRVHGSGSGAPDPDPDDDSNGPNASARGCAELLRQLPVDLDRSPSGMSTQVWGEAEIALDGARPAAVLIHMLDRNGQPRDARPMEVPVFIQ